MVRMFGRVPIFRISRGDSKEENEAPYKLFRLTPPPPPPHSVKATVGGVAQWLGRRSLTGGLSA